MYERRSRLNESRRDRLMEHFVAGTTVLAAAELVGIHRNTAASFFTRLRKHSLFAPLDQLRAANARRT